MTRLPNLRSAWTRPLVAVSAVLALGGLTACSQVGVSAQDAYKIGCPAVDSAVAGGSVANQATVAGLQALSDSGQLGPEAQQWLDSAIAVLRSAKPQDLPADARKLVVDGCAENGYPLRNLKG